MNMMIPDNKAMLQNFTTSQLLKKTKLSGLIHPHLAYLELPAACSISLWFSRKTVNSFPICPFARVQFRSFLKTGDSYSISDRSSKVNRP